MFKLPDSFEIKKPSPWSAEPTIENAEQKKILFGVEIGKGIEAFKAALNVCQNNTNEALWISQHWLLDPVVIASSDKYSETVDNSKSLLDKDQLAAKLLKMAEEKNATETFYLLDGKDRLKALELYALVRGYTGKAAIDLSTTNNTFKQMIVKFVEPDKKDNSSSNETEILNNKLPSPLKLKLVG